MEKPAEEDGGPMVIDDEEDGWDEDDVHMQLERETEEQREADWQQLIREVENFDSELSNSPRSSITDPGV